MRKGCDRENMDVQWGYMLFRGLICCSGGLYAVHEGYINVQEGFILFRGVICCSGGLYGCPGGLYVKSISLKERMEA